MDYKTHSNQEEFEASFDNFLTSEQLIYFKLLMAGIGITSLVSSIIFTIQQQDVKLIAFLVVTTSINFLLLFMSKTLQRYMKYVLGILYLIYIAGITVVGKNGENVPLFIHGYSSGVLFSTMTQFCDYKLKVLFIVSTPWVFFILFDNFSISSIHFIVYTLSTSVLFGFMTYQYDNKQKWIFSQNDIIKKQENVIKQFTTDSLFAISYDERSRVFKVEFTNKSFNNAYSDDISEFLRNHVVVCEGEQQMKKSSVSKQDTLEEFLFANQQKKQDWESKGNYIIQIKHKASSILLDLQITHAYFYKCIYFIAIKSQQTNVSIDKYECIILKQKQSIIALCSEMGFALQHLYKSFNSKVGLNLTLEFFKNQQSDILILLNRAKNYLIYYQKEKILSMNNSTDQYDLKVVLGTLMQLLEVKSKQQQKIFIYQLSSINEKIIMKLDQKLFTQIFVNIFCTILSLSSYDSIIRLIFSFNENQKLKPSTLPQKSHQQKQEVQNSYDTNNLQVLQFTFEFTSDIEINNLDQLLCSDENKQEGNKESNWQIEKFVNFIILQLIGPYNYIIANKLFSSVLNKYLYDVTFYTYTDLTNLDISFTKQLKIWNK